jgi:hypothetical protein
VVEGRGSALGKLTCHHQPAYTHANAHTQKRFTYTYTYIHTHIHIHIHIHIHSYTVTHTQLHIRKQTACKVHSFAYPTHPYKTRGYP